MDIVYGGGLTTFVNKQSQGTRAEYSSMLSPGWWYGVVLNGEVQTEQNGFGRAAWKRRTFVHFWCDHELETYHRELTDASMSAVFVHIQPEAAELLLGDDVKLVAGDEARKSSLHRSGHVTRAMSQIAQQMLTTARIGTDRRLYLAGRAHDLVSSVLEFEKGRGENRSEPSITLTRRDFGHVADAADAILSNLKSPPTCNELAATLGLSPKKLARGFKAVHGLTLGAFVAEKRWELSRRMLEEGAPSVSSVAYELGFHPAYFATEFKRRYGFSPSSLISK